MKQRYTPFGYAVKDGKHICCEVEADAVRRIFADYQHGKTLQDIAAQMAAEGIRYHHDNALWNKNMVKRILENQCYLGGDEYPAIVTAEQFEKSARTRATKSQGNTPAPPHVAVMRSVVYCGECGGKLIRKTPVKNHSRWYCETKDCTKSIHITDALLKDGVTALLNRLIAAPVLVEQQTPQPLPAGLEITRLHHEISREIDKANCNEDSAKTLIMACAAEQYRLCEDGSAQRMSKKIKQLFEYQSPLAEFDAALFSATVDRVLVYQDGTLGIRLKNNQTVRKGA